MTCSSQRGHSSPAKLLCHRRVQIEVCVHDEVGFAKPVMHSKHDLEPFVR